MSKTFSETLLETPITWGLIAIHFVLFGLVTVQEPTLTREVLRTFGGQFNPDIWSGEYHRLLIAGLLHGSLLHVLMNNISLYVLGRLLEQLVGSTAFLLLYLLSLLAGNVASLHWIPPMVVSVGASGAIMGLAGGLFVWLWLDRRGRFLTTRPSGRYLFFLMVLFYLLIGEFIPIINNAAHLGGFVMGGIFGLFFWSRIPGESVPRVVGSIALFLALGGFGVMASQGVRPEGSYAWHFYHGLQAFHKANVAESEQHLQQALQRKTEKAALYYLAQLYFQTQQYTKAVTVYQQLQSKDPNSGEHWYYWLVSLHNSQQSAKAAQVFAQASSWLEKQGTSLGGWLTSVVNPDQARLWQWAHLYAAHRREKEALLTYQKLLEQYPENTALHNEMAWLLVTAHDPNYRNPTLALKHATFAVSRSTQTNPGYLDTLALAQFLNGQPKQAIESMQQAIQAEGAKEIMPHLHFQRQRFKQSVRKQENVLPTLVPARTRTPQPIPTTRPRLR